jgi:hypothetical protein
MTNLVVGAAVGYHSTQIMPFLKSLRMFYSGQIVFLIAGSQQQDLELMDTFDRYGVEHIPIDVEPANYAQIMYKRFGYYLSLLTNNKFAHCSQFFLTDVRDVIFQASPFSLPQTCDLEFFLEPIQFKNCHINNWWILEKYGIEECNVFQDKYVICSGTILCTPQGLADVCTALTAEIQKFEQLGAWPTDQPILNHLVYNNRLSNYKMVHSAQGRVSTVSTETLFLFNRQGQLCNQDGSIVPVVHQHDRHPLVAELLLRAIP